MVHTPVKLFDVLIYAEKSVGLFVALMVGISAGLMIVRTIIKRSEGTGKQKKIKPVSQSMKTTKQIESEINGVYKKLNSLREKVNEAIDRVGGICHNIELLRIEESDSSLMSLSAKELFEAADSIFGYADDDLPHLATLLRERFEYDQEHCGVCDEPLAVAVGDDERELDHRGCQ